MNSWIVVCKECNSEYVPGMGTCNCKKEKKWNDKCENGIDKCICAKYNVKCVLQVWKEAKE